MAEDLRLLRPFGPHCGSAGILIGHKQLRGRLLVKVTEDVVIAGGGNTSVTIFNKNYNNITLLVFSAGVKYECKQTGKHCTFTVELEYCA